MEDDERRWNRVYKGFKGKRYSVWREQATPFFTEKIDFLEHKKIKKILDAGCGDGRNLMPFAEAGFQVTGVDISAIALDRCKERTKNYGNVILKQVSLEKLDCKKSSFDAVICDFVLVHMRKVEKVLDNFHRVLRKEGYALLEFISEKDKRCNKGQKVGRNQYIQKGVFIRTFTIKDIERLLKKFKILSIDAVEYSDPHHGKGYHRKKRHKHHSYFVLAQK